MSIERAQLSVAFCLGRLRAQTDDLANRQYPGDHAGPSTWLELIHGILDTAENYLTESRHARSQKKAKSLGRDAARLCNQAYTALGFLRGAATDELPYPLVPAMQRWLNDLGLGNTAIFRAEAVTNYELKKIEDKLFRRIRNPSTRLTVAINGMSWPVLRITVPSKAFAIIPHFAIVAHEIGHALFPLVTWDISSFAKREENKLRNRVAARLGVRRLGRDTGEILVSVFAAWFQELASDAIAMYLTGPAIFFAFADFAQLLAGGYGLSVSHPPHDMRRKILFKELTRGGRQSFSAVFKKHTGSHLSAAFNSPLVAATPSSDQIFNDAISGALHRQYDRQTAAVIAELHTSIESLTPSIYTQAKKFLITQAPSALYTPAKYDDDLRSHLKPMLAAIPPVERRKSGHLRPAPSDFASILNVGWVTVLTKLDKLRVATESNTSADRLEALHGLLLKAVELSEIRREWESA